MSVKNMNGGIFDKYIAEADKPVLVIFQSNWCIYCKRLAPAIKDIAEMHAYDLTVGQVDIDLSTDLAKRENVQVVPTFVLYNHGKVLGSITAPDSRDKIEAFIHKHLDL